jgi:TolB-like protein/tetratricopeptide (TPR) repeat protein
LETDGGRPRMTEREKAAPSAGNDGHIGAVFISYASADFAKTDRIVAALERSGLRCWFAPRDVGAGALYAEAIMRAINECKALILILSANSIASNHVGREIERASSKRRKIIALRIDDAPLSATLEYFLSESQWLDARKNGLDATLAKVIAAIPEYGATPASEAPAKPTHPSPPSSRYFPLLARVGIAVIALLAVIVTASFWSTNRIKPDQPRINQTQGLNDKSISPQATISPPAGVSLAVLPFVDMSPEHNQDYFSDGLSEELLNQLAQIKELRVTGRTSSFSFKGKNEDLRVIGAKLGVNHLLEGSVRKSDKRLRVTAQLINATDGTHLWSKSYDRDLNDVFAVQEEIAMAVAGALSITLDIGDMSRAKGGTINVDAYDKYLHARTLFYRLGPTELEQSAQLYREALALDPNFARAWSGLYAALVYSRTWIPENSAAELREMAEASVHIISLAPDAWWTQVMRSNQYAQQHKWSEAIAAAHAAMTAAPASEIEALTNYGDLLLIVGRARESIEYVRRAREIDPLSLAVSGELQLYLDFAGRPADAQAEYERSKGFPGDHAIWDWYAVRRLWRRKDATPAVVEAQFRVFLTHESLPMALSQVMVGNLSNKAAARTAIREAFQDPSNQDATRIGVVGQYADHFGDKDLALVAFRRAMVELPTEDFTLLWNPYETGLRADPRFKDILRNLGLVDYFRKTGNWGDFCKPVGKDDFECH